MIQGEPSATVELNSREARHISEGLRLLTIDPKLTDDERDTIDHMSGLFDMLADGLLAEEVVISVIREIGEP